MFTSSVRGSARFLLQKWQYQALARAESRQTGQTRIIEAWDRMGSGAHRDGLTPLLPFVGSEGPPQDRQKDQNPDVDQASIVAEQRSVLTPTFLLSALVSSWVEGADLFGGWVFAGHKLYGLKLVPRGMRGSVQILEAFSVPAVLSSSDRQRESVVSEQRWAALGWENARRMVMAWDPRSRQVQRISYKAPLVGDVELVLEGFTPG